jgi:hypothetical protein
MPKRLHVWKHTVISNHLYVTACQDFFALFQTHFIQEVFGTRQLVRAHLANQLSPKELLCD